MANQNQADGWIPFDWLRFAVRITQTSLVKTCEGLCPFCRAYEKVYGRKSHEPIPPQPKSGRANIPVSPDLSP